jgi:hypothetical protein
VEQVGGIKEFVTGLVDRSWFMVVCVSAWLCASFRQMPGLAFQSLVKGFTGHRFLFVLRIIFPFRHSILQAEIFKHRVLHIILPAGLHIDRRPLGILAKYNPYTIPPAAVIVLVPVTKTPIGIFPGLVKAFDIAGDDDGVGCGVEGLAIATKTVEQQEEKTKLAHVGMFVES